MLRTNAIAALENPQVLRGIVCPANPANQPLAVSALRECSHLAMLSPVLGVRLEESQVLEAVVVFDSVAVVDDLVG